MKQDRIEKEFRVFHKQQPSIWKEFERLALHAINKGRRHYSAKAIFEVIRWHSIDWKRDSIHHYEYEINNNYTALYARMFAKRHPQHKNFFRMRARG